MDEVAQAGLENLLSVDLKAEFSPFLIGIDVKRAEEELKWNRMSSDTVASEGTDAAAARLEPDAPPPVPNTAPVENTPTLQKGMRRTGLQARLSQWKMVIFRMFADFTFRELCRQ
ncbi:MAG: hypothetical protein ACQESR_22700 [Planctomycetota bacterium]